MSTLCSDESNYCRWWRMQRRHVRYISWNRMLRVYSCIWWDKRSNRGKSTLQLSNYIVITFSWEEHFCKLFLIFYMFLLFDQCSSSISTVCIAIDWRWLVPWIILGAWSFYLSQVFWLTGDHEKFFFRHL